MSTTSAVFVQTNELDSNRVIAFRRDAGGVLSSLESHPTGGAGTGMPHLPSQGSVVLSADGRSLLVANAGSGEISVFGVSTDGLALAQTIPSGDGPRSIAEHDGLVYVLNTGTPSVTGFRLDGHRLTALPGSYRSLAEDADPAQIGFSPEGTTLVATQRGSNSIVAFPVDESGHLSEPREIPSSGPTPYGFAFGAGGTLIVTEAFGAQIGKAAASSYVLDGPVATAVSQSVANGRSEICWAVASGDGRYAFTTNFGDGAVSRYAISSDGALQLEDAAAATAIVGQKGLRDEDISSDGRFLYAIDADARRIFGWAVDDHGSLDPIGSWDGLPATVAGLAAS